MRLLGPPMFVLAAVQALVMVGAFNQGRAILDPDVYAMWDSWHYIRIAEDGYTLFRCPPEWGFVTPQDWCGEAGWLPLYPILMAGVRAATRVTYTEAGLIVTWAAQLGVLVLAWWLLGATFTARNVTTLVLVGVFPGVVWSHAVFPVSLTVLLMMLTAVLLAGDRYLWAGVAAGLTAVSHSVGVILVALAGAWVLYREVVRRDDVTPVGRAGNVLRFGIPAVLPYAALLIWFQVALGHWNAWFLATSSQRVQYGLPPLIWLQRTGQRAPEHTVIDEETETVLGIMEVIPDGWVTWQEGLLLLLVAGAIVLAVLNWRRMDLTMRLLFGFTLAVWLFNSFLGPPLAFWRVAAFATPLALMYRYADWRVTALLAGLGVAVVLGVAKVHASGVLF